MGRDEYEDIGLELMWLRSRRNADVAGVYLLAFMGFMDYVGVCKISNINGLLLQHSRLSHLRRYATACWSCNH